jgi:cysteine desulfurase
VVSGIEHPSISYWCHNILPLFSDLELEVVKPTGLGQITPERVMEHVTKDTDIVSIIHASNETGIVNDIATICAKAKERSPECIFHTDCA